MKVGLLGIAASLVFAAALAAQTPAEVSRSIERGVAYLKGSQKPNGFWEFATMAHEAKGNSASVGATGLAALTLLEVGDLEKDAALQACVRKAAEVVRSNAGGLTYTYAIATNIWFLDRLIGTPPELRLSEPGDRKLLLDLADRLRRGQSPGGGWTYHVPLGGKAEAGSQSDDNSNTQFAVLALWTARRHGLNPDDNLRKAAERFRASQSKTDNGWCYVIDDGGKTPSTPAMTCSGLIGLAVGHAIKVKKRSTVLRQEKPPSQPTKEAPAAGPLVGKDDDDIKDPDVKRAMEYLSRELGGTYLVTAHALYGLWSVERVATIYGNLRRINGKEWYPAGAQVIVPAQQADGSWAGSYAGPVDTCFALLFLAKVNLFDDLSKALRGEDTLTAGADAKGTSKGPDSTAEAGTGTTKGPDGAKSPAKSPVPETPGLTESATAEDIAAQILKADGAKQPGLLMILKEGKGPAYTEAMVDVIPKLTGSTQQRAREMLAERLTRMTSRQLRTYMEADQPAELRRAAASACGLKGDSGLLLDLMGLMKDKDAGVAAAAKQAHNKLTGKGSGGR